MQQKKKILHIATSLTWRGGEQQAAYLIEELKDEVENIVLCSTGSKFESFCKQKGIKYFTQKYKRSIDFGYAKTLGNICQSESIDICHLHDAHALTYAILSVSIYGNKTPIILSRRVDFPINNNWFSKFKYNHPSVIKILCVSQKILEITADRIKDKSKLKTVYSGIDLGKFKKPSNKLRHEYDIPENAFLVGNTSALADHKDYFTFIDVAEKVINMHDNCYFIIMGDGPMKREIINYAQKKKLSEKLVFTGFRSDIPEVLGELDTFFISSKTEGLGTSILDAFACKVPVVATNAGGIPELVENEKTGLLCPVKHVNSLVEAIQRLKNEESLRSKLVNNAAQKVKEFDKKNTAKETLAEYFKVFS